MSARFEVDLETQPASLPGLEVKEGKMKLFSFDPRIDMGHIITFAGMLVSVAMLYSNIDKRLTIIERANEQSVAVRQVDDRRTEQQMADVKNDLKNIQKDIQDIKIGIAAGSSPVFFGGASRSGK